MNATFREVGGARSVFERLATEYEALSIEHEDLSIDHEELEIKYEALSIQHKEQEERLKLLSVSNYSITVSLI
jgi:hypothetical protein